MDMDPPRGRFILIVAALVSLVWIAAAAALGWRLLAGVEIGQVALTEWAAIAAGLFAPLTAIWLIALIVARIDPGRGRDTLSRLEAAEARFQESAAMIRAQIDGLDERVDRLGERAANVGAVLGNEGEAFAAAGERTAGAVERLSESVARETGQLDAATAGLVERVEGLDRQFMTFAEQLPIFETDVGRIGDGLASAADAASGRVEQLEGRLVAIGEADRKASTEALRRGEDANSLLEHMDRTVADLDAQLGERAGVVEASVDAAITRMRTASDDLDRLVTDQAAALTSATDRARQLLDDASMDAVTTAEERLTTLSNAADGLNASFARHDDSSRNVVARVESDVSTVGERIAEIVGAFDEFKTRVGAGLSTLRDEAEGLVLPLDNGVARAADLSREVGTLTEGLTATETLLVTALPERAEDTRQRLGGLRSEIDALEQDFARLGGAAEALGRVREVAVQA
ncbi:MAG: hypothetical protein AAGD40_04185, partial [Pseudomonadota bacterium]